MQHGSVRIEVVLTLYEDGHLEIKRTEEDKCRIMTLLKIAMDSMQADAIGQLLEPKITQANGSFLQRVGNT